MKITCYVVYNAKGEPQGIDQNSGGYPYSAQTPNSINFFSTKEEAEKYAKTVHMKVAVTTIYIENY